MNEILSRLLTMLNFDIIEIILLALLFVVLVIQFYFYLAFYRSPLRHTKKGNTSGGYESTEQKQPKISVIIVSENESENLTRNLPAILEQDYPNYEVIVVNDGSTDESDVLLESLKLKHPNLYSTYLPISPDRNFAKHKLAMTLGIKAATGDYLLFTEPYCKPVSQKWISSMVACLGIGKEVVLGYSYYKTDNKFYNKTAQFDNLLFSLQYMSMALKNKPYTGTFRNVLFPKELFFNQKGFSSLLNIENGEEAFINRIVNESNAALALSQDSFIEADLYSASLWRQIRRSYRNVKKYFSRFTPKIFSVEYVSRALFYVLFLLLIIKAFFPFDTMLIVLACLLFLVRLTLQLVVLNKAAAYFKTTKFYLSMMPLDINQLWASFSLRKQRGRK